MYTVKSYLLQVASPLPHPVGGEEEYKGAVRLQGGGRTLGTRYDSGGPWVVVRRTELRQGGGDGVGSNPERRYRTRRRLRRLDQRDEDTEDEVK